MTTVARSQVLEVVQRVNGRRRALEIAPELPDPVDLERDDELLARLHVTLGQLRQQMGDGP